MPQRFKQKSDY